MYTFAHWVSTPENRSALLAVQQVSGGVCSEQRREVNPLFLHGPAGTGKTHLVSALASDVIARQPDLTCRLFSAADCIELLGGSRDGRNVTPTEPSEAWDADLLVVEDLQHLPARVAPAFTRVLDTRLARGQQTVLTAGCGPGQLVHLPVRLTSRLASGLVVGIEPLAPASRLAYLRDRAARRQLAVDRDVLAWLADHAGPSARQLDGALTRVETLSQLGDHPPDVAVVASHFGAEVQASRPSVDRIAERVSSYFQVDRRQVQSRRRLRHALLPRQVSMYLARQLTPLSLSQIGAYFGGRDHSTVLHACRKVEQAMARDAALSGAVRQLRADLA
jgi:chromosomal replication initiator protein